MGRPASFRAGFTGVFLALASAMAASPALAADDGARAYRLAPKGVRAAQLWGIATRGNTTASGQDALINAQIDVNMAIPLMVLPFSLGGNMGVLGAALPMGKVTGRVTAGQQTLRASDSGLADAQVFALVGLVNMPSLKAEDYVKKQAGTTLALITKASIPIGSHSGQRALNLGANRWAFTAGLPLNIALTDSYVDPGYASIEIMPSVTFYTPDNDPFGAALRVTKKPYYLLEMHVTKNLSAKTFVSFDVLAGTGGATRTDGIANNDTTEGVGVGVTMATMLSSSIELRGSVGTVLAKNATGFNTDLFRIGLTKAF